MGLPLGLWLSSAPPFPSRKGRVAKVNTTLPPDEPGNGSIAVLLQDRLQQLYAPLARKMSLQFTVIVSRALDEVQITGGGANFIITLIAGKKIVLGPKRDEFATKFMQPLAESTSPFEGTEVNSGQGIVTGKYCGLLMSARIGSTPANITTLNRGDRVDISGTIYKR
jgi:hypothetical protein